ncbi:alanine racemase [Thiomicrorhabdus aquaedulcis]|uniref:alanine racemase n=1 Tax=Thiomicrorhabdus aquaedulcis TaxID=2211106 RepID=UPI000FDADE9D|nr:alanine racemase [Thiomicrorhabdus aquaedulcis]
MTYRPAKALIDCSALKHNLALIKSLAPHSKVLAVIKANGYGHGMHRVAQQLVKADGFGVASMDEAIYLRQQGFLHRILLLEGVFSEAELHLAAQHRIDVVVHASHQLHWLLDNTFENTINVWIKVDTGMHRLGFLPDEVPNVLSKLQPLVKRYPIHVMTHLASADEDSLQAQQFTQQQLSCFASLFNHLNYPKSVVNSAGVQKLVQAQFDWIRPGILLYGAGNLQQLDARAVMTLSSEIIALKWISAGESVGYGNAWTAQNTTLVGVVAMGYGDGYPRHAPSGTPLWIKGQRVALIGRVSMDMIMIDLTTMAEHVALGDVVECWGKNVSVDEVARYAGTIGYELLCGVTQRVPMIEIH